MAQVEQGSKSEKVFFKIESAKPGIPAEKPQRRTIPDIIDPLPDRVPFAPPVKAPREPVPSRS